MTSTDFIGPVSDGRTSSSVTSQAEHNVGTTTSPTKSDEVKVMIRVSGRYFMNSPTIPGQNVNGRKAAKVVAVEAIIGMATSPVPSLAASISLQPSSRKR